MSGVQFVRRNVQYFDKQGQAQQKHYLVYTSEYNGSSNIYTGIVEALGSDSFTLMYYNYNLAVKI